MMMMMATSLFIDVHKEAQFFSTVVPLFCVHCPHNDDVSAVEFDGKFRVIDGLAELVG